MDTLAIIKRIELRLLELNMTKAEFYEKSGISSASYSQWNTGRYNPSKRKLENAAKCLETTYEYLAFGQETEKTPTQEGKREVSDDDIKFALFGGDGEITDAMFDEVKRFAKMVKLREEAERKE